MNFRNESYKKGALYSSSLSIVAKLIAFAQNILIAYAIGANVSTDIYFYLFNFTILMGNMGQNIVTSVLVPRIIELRMNGRRKAEMSYVNSFVYLLLAIGSLLTLLVWIFGSTFMQWVSGFSAVHIEQNLPILILLAPVTVIYVINMVYAEVLVSYKYFTFPLFVNIVYNMFIILSILLFHRWQGIQSAVWGIALATVINFCWQTVFMKRNVRWSFAVVKFSTLKETFSDNVTIVLNQLVGIFVSMFPMYLLSQLSPGIVTVASYAAKLTQTPMAVVNQILFVFQIKLNELVSSRAFGQIKRLFVRVISMLATVCLLGAAVLYALKHYIIRLLYGYGGMDGDLLSLQVIVFGIFVFSMPFTALAATSSKLFFAMKQVKKYTLITVTAGVVISVINYLLIQKSGVIGFAYAFVLAEAIMGAWLLAGSVGLLNKLGDSRSEAWR